MRVTHANYADVCGKLADPSPTPTGATDIGQLTAAGFSNGKIPVWSVAQKKFLPGNLPSPSPSPPASQRYVNPMAVEWDVPPIAPLQSVYADLPFIGAIPATPCAVGVPFDMQFCWIRADVIQNDLVRITVTNLNLTTVDLGNGLYNVQLFQLAS